MKEKNFINIFKAFFKIGIILLGGGYVIVPIMKDELLLKRNWLSEDEIFDFYCVSQCLPGIIAINMSILTGYKLLKFKGVIASVIGIGLSPFVSIIILAHLLSKIAGIPFIESIFWGVNLSVIILIYLTLKDIWKKSIVDIFSVFWFIFILICSIYNVNAVILILASIVLGITASAKKEKTNE